ncbi:MULTISPECIES: alpha/beta hydrolase [unclassified Sphingopyxis]|uniref:alpha/beta fold hydrolase n=1 Tax=unclassified Sphingopyxis TaxID=2614943 RepID=UPI00286755B0|nr:MULTISPECIES: alpha/beta hydrolase [unclassified Sphingopyxis]MDR6834633.1 pimeloyl-ACP methyl ester carboxylesterase [Sphingopyxis sp. BE122]MDR7226903.1 pimeloyl-ACP methyl ester carboxylesterase [Sphingopyxis sp. BE259]
MNRHTSVAATFLLAVGLLAGRADAAEPCPTGMVEGKRITVQVEGDGPDVVLIPGLSSPRGVWDSTADRLRAKHRLHRIQIRGFGDEAGINAEGPVLDPMMREVADYIDNCITDRGRAAPAIIGHSMGGLTGLMIAARAPDEVGKLMIVDALPFIGTLFNPAATVDSVKPQAEQMAAMMRAQYGQPVPTTPVSDPGPVSMVGSMSNQPAGRTAILGWMRSADARVTAQVFHDVMTTDMRGELAAVTAPVTLLYAQDDSLMPAERAKAAFEPQYVGVAKFTAQMVSGSRHFIMLDQPEAFAKAVDDFLAD